MGWLQDFNNSISGFASNTQNSINDAVPALKNTGGYLTDAFKQNVPDDVQRTFWDQSRDNPINATMRGAEFSRGLAQGQNMFAGKDELEYKQNVAKRAAIVAAVFGGAAVGGAGAGANSAAAAAPEVSAAGSAGTTAVPGTMAAIGETLGVAAPAATPGTTAAMASGAAVPGSAGLASTAAPAAAATAPAVASSGSWAPYATAGGTILSTLFSGLMQMEQQKEALKREKQMALAKSRVEKAQAENEALNRLIQVWQGARR